MRFCILTRPTETIKAAAAKWLATWIPTEIPKPAPTTPKKVQSFMRKKYLKKEFYWDGSVVAERAGDGEDLHAAVSVGALLAFNRGQLAPPPKYQGGLLEKVTIETTPAAKAEQSDDDFAEFISAFPSASSTSKASQNTTPPVKAKADPFSDLFGLNWSTSAPTSQENVTPQSATETHAPAFQTQETLLSWDPEVMQSAPDELVSTETVVASKPDELVSTEPDADDSFFAPLPQSLTSVPVTAVTPVSDYEALRAMMEADTVVTSQWDELEASGEPTSSETLPVAVPMEVTLIEDPFQTINSILDVKDTIPTGHSSVEKEMSKSTLVDQLSTLSLGSDSVAVTKGTTVSTLATTATNPWDFPDKRAQTQFQFSFDNVWS
jgi:hypothetical protein